MSSSRNCWGAAALVVTVVAAGFGCKRKGASSTGTDAALASNADAAGASSVSGDKLDAIELAEDARASGAVLPYLRDADPAVRAQAARALGRIADAPTMEESRRTGGEPVGHTSTTRPDRTGAQAAE